MTPGNRASRADVARAAGVSEATVSYAFTKGRYVSQELVAKVMEAARELGYVPDMVARSMVKKSTKTIGVLTSDMASPLQMQVIKGMQKAAMAHGYFVNVCGGEDNLESYIDNFISRRMDGVFISVLSSLVRDVYFSKLADRGISVIATSTRRLADDRICGLELNMAAGMTKIAEYLRSLGHRDVAYLSAFDEAYESDRRIKCFRRSMNDVLGVREPLVIPGAPPYDSTIESGEALARRLMQTGARFTAVVATNDMMAFGAIKAFRDAGLRVPEDVSVVGIDNIMFSAIFSPALTTLDHGGERYGEKLFELLYDNMTNHTVRREFFEPELIIRDSCCNIEK